MRELVFQGSLYGFIAEMVLWVIFAFVLSLINAKKNKEWLNSVSSISLSLIFFFIIAFNFSFEEPSAEESVQTSDVSVK